MHSERIGAQGGPLCALECSELGSPASSLQLFIACSHFQPSPSANMAKRKVDSENRGFQARWEAEYMFTEVKGKPICLLCGDSVSVMKEYNLRRHYETSTKHTGKETYKNMNTEQKLQKVEELKRCLKSRQALFTKATSQAEAAVKASFIVAHEVANHPGRLSRESL